VHRVVEESEMTCRTAQKWCGEPVKRCVQMYKRIGIIFVLGAALVACQPAEEPGAPGVETPALETPANGMQTPANGMETPANGFETPANGFETPANGFETPAAP
jgi:hypothetical protein